MVDTISEMLRSAHPTRAIFLDAHFTAPWFVHTEILARTTGPSGQFIWTSTLI
jgi:hypothetical protein